MIKEAILKSVLILSMRSREEFLSRIPNHLQLLHSQITGVCELTALLMNIKISTLEIKTDLF